jgi:hypothetical protein
MVLCWLSVVFLSFCSNPAHYNFFCELFETLHRPSVRTACRTFVRLPCRVSWQRLAELAWVFAKMGAATFLLCPVYIYGAGLPLNRMIRKTSVCCVMDRSICDLLVFRCFDFFRRSCECVSIKQTRFSLISSWPWRWSHSLSPKHLCLFSNLHILWRSRRAWVGAEGRGRYRSPLAIRHWKGVGGQHPPSTVLPPQRPGALCRGVRGLQGLFGRREKSRPYRNSIPVPSSQ